MYKTIAYGLAGVGIDIGNVVKKPRPAGGGSSGEVHAWMGYKVEPKYTEEWSRSRQRVGQETRTRRPMSGESPSRSEQALRAGNQLSPGSNRSRSWATHVKAQEARYSPSGHEASSRSRG